MRAHVTSAVVVVGLALALPGCRCLTVVADDTDGATDAGDAGHDAGHPNGDGGSDAGLDGGFDGGSDGGQDGGSDGGLDCQGYLDCQGLPFLGNVTWCAGVEGSSSYSCIDGQCLWECHGHRTCTTDGGCEDCTTPVFDACSSGCTPMARTCTGMVEQSTCGAWLGEGVGIDLDSSCRQTITLCDGGVVGSWQLHDGAHASGEFTGLGECTAEQLPTNLIRWVVNCGQCQLAISF